MENAFDEEKRLYYSNLVEVEGFVSKGPEYHHSTHGEDIYLFELRAHIPNILLYHLI